MLNKFKTNKLILVSILCIFFTILSGIFLFLGDYKLGFIALMIFYTIIFLLAIVYSLKTNNDLFEINNIFMGVYFLYTTGFQLNGIYYSGGIPPYYSYILQTIFAIIGFICYWVGYNKILKPNKLNNKTSIKGSNINFIILLFAIFSFLIIGCLSFATELNAYGGLARYIKIGYGAERYLIDKSKVHGNGLQWISSTILILYIVATIYKDEYKKLTLALRIFVYASSLAIMYCYFFTGNRHSLVIYLITFAAIIHYYYYRVEIKLGLIAFSVLFILLIMYTSFRGLLGGGNLMSNLMEAIKSKRFEIFYFQIGEFSQTSKSLNEVIFYTTQNGYSYGMSYLISLVAWIPGAGRLFDVSKYALSIWRLKSFYPGDLQKGLGVGFFSLSEMFLNFGVVGIILGMSLWGMFLKKLFILFKENKRSIYIAFVYCYSVSMVSFDFMRIDFQTFFSAYMQGLAIPLGLIFIAYKVLEGLNKIVFKNREAI